MRFLHCEVIGRFENDGNLVYKHFVGGSHIEIYKTIVMIISPYKSIIKLTGKMIDVTIKKMFLFQLWYTLNKYTNKWENV